MTGTPNEIDASLALFFPSRENDPLGVITSTVRRRRQRRFRYGLYRALLLVAILIVPGVLEPISQMAGFAPVRQAAASAGRVNQLPDQDERHQAAPPSPSGANPPYPLNHTLDAEVIDLGGPTNADFETAGYDVGGPTNAGFDTAPYSVGSQPTNNDFATGTFSGWSTSGSGVSIQTSGGPDSQWARLNGTNGAITSSAFTVDSSAQVVLFDLGSLTASGTAGLQLSVLSRSGYTTNTILRSFSCTDCNSFVLQAASLAAFQGQSIKLKFLRSSGTIGIDRVRQSVIAEGFANTDNIHRLGSDPYIKIYDGNLTSSAFTIDSSAQLLTVRLAGLSGSSDQAYVDILSGGSYATVTTVLTVTADDWATFRANLSSWSGQSVKVRVRQLTGTLGVDDLGVQRVELPGWTLSDVTRRVSDGGSGYAAYGDDLTSSAITLSADVQQVMIHYKVSSSGTGLYFEMLRGSGYSTVVALAGGPLGGTIGQWTTYKPAIDAYSGQSVKFRVRPQLGAVTVDNLGLTERIVPGWTFASSSGAATIGEDANGTYVRSFTSNGTVNLNSSQIDLGVVDDTGFSDGRSYVISYDLGYSNPSVLYIDWVPDVGSSTRVYQDTASSPTGFKNGRFTVWETMEQSGHFWVHITGGSRFYSFGDNVARQQLAEPFSQQVRFAGGSSVDTSSGSFGLSGTDLAIQGGPLPLVFTRYYAGHSDRQAEFGFRWSHSYDAFAAAYAGGDVAIVFGSGKEEFFDWNSAYSFFKAIDPRVTSTLTKVTVSGDLLYKHVTKEGLITYFATNTAGDLISIQDRNGNQITVYRSTTTGLITSVDDDAGRALTFSYDGNNRLSSVTDPEGGTATYSYDSAGDLVAVEQAIASGATPARTEYTYLRHRLISVKQRQGDDTTNSMVTILTNELDDYNRVIAQTDAQSNTISIAYQSPDDGVTEVTDALSNVTQYYFDAFARTTHVELPGGEVSQFVFNSTGELQKVIDGSNGEHEFSYNGDRDPDQITDPLDMVTTIDWDSVKHLPTETIVDPGNRGSGFLNLRTLYTYDSAGNLTQTVVDPTDSAQPGTELNLVTTWAYNGQGNVTQEIIDPGSSPHLNLVTTYSYDSTGTLLLSQTVDPGSSPHLGLTTSYTYDYSGRLKTETDPNLHTTTYSYDLAGRMIERENHLGQSICFGHDFQGHVTAVMDALGHTAYFTYNSRGLMTSKTDGEGNVWAYTYTDNGRLETVTDPLSFVTTRDYDDNGRLWHLTDPLNNVTTYTYTVTGQLETVTDPLNRTTGYQYDDSGRLTFQINPDLSFWEYQYDAAGRLIKTIDPLGHWTTNGYDTASQLIQTIVDADNPGLAGSERNQVTAFDYDAAGRTIFERIDPGSSPHLNLVTESQYDAAGRLTQSIDSRGKSQHYSYYPGGQIASVQDESGEFTWYEYDAADRLIEQTDPDLKVTNFGFDAAGRRTSISSGGILTTFSYDNRDLILTQVVDPNPPGQSGHLALTTSFGYDDLGRRTSVTNPRGKTSTTEYDANGRMSSITDANSEVILLTYDDAGQLDTVTNARGYLTDHDWDINGNPDSITDALNQVEEYDYNSLGQMTAMTDRRGVTTSYTYDGAGNPETISYPAFGGALAGTITFTFDAANRQKTMADQFGTTSWSYDSTGNLLQVDGPNSGDAIDYTYDDAGRRESMTLPGSKTVTYGRDAGGRVTSITDWQSQLTEMTYTDFGSLDTISRPNGVDSNFDFDTAGRLDLVEHTDGSTLLARYGYALDANGNRTQVVTTGTAVTAHTETYTYDDLDRILTASYGPSDSVSWTYDENGNRLTQTSGGLTTSYVYNELDWMTETSGAFISATEYDDAGNRTGVCYTTSCTTPTDLFGYDWKSRTTSATVGGQSVEYAYTGDDIRATRTEGSTTTTYLWDREGLLPVLVGDGATDRIFLEDQVLEEISGSADAYPLSDALRSVRLTTDDSGTPSGAVDYDVWGNTRSGTSGQLGWTGELQDSTTGQIHLRARDYSPGTGRFTSRDSLVPNATGTNGYNPYWYANSNPVTLTDPTGHVAIAPDLPRGLAGLAAAGSALAAIASAATRNYVTALLWAGNAFFLIAAILICAANPTCRSGDSFVTGHAISAVEQGKTAIVEGVDSAKRIHDSLTSDNWQRNTRQPQQAPTPAPTPGPVPTIPPSGYPKTPTPDEDGSKNWVVRGGRAAANFLLDGAREHLRVPGLFGISVQFQPGKTVQELGCFIKSRFLSYATD